MSTEQQFNIDDRVEWLGFIKENRGETPRPLGTLGTVTQLGTDWRGGPDIVYIDWDGSHGTVTTWVENVRLVDAKETPVESDPGLRERMLDKAIKAADFGPTTEDIVAAAIAFEAYVTGAAK